MGCATAYRAYRDARKIFDDMNDPSQFKSSLEALLGRYNLLRESQIAAAKIIKSYPQSTGARILKELCELSEPGITSKKGFQLQLKRELGALDRRVSVLLKKKSAIKPEDKWHSSFICRWQISKILRKPEYTLGGITKQALNKIPVWKNIVADSGGATKSLVNLNTIFGDMNGIVIAKTKIKAPRTGTWDLKAGYDGGVRVFVDGKQVIDDPARKNPAVYDRTVVPVKLSKGTHWITVAQDTDGGQGWGFYLRFGIPRNMQKKTVKSVFPEEMQK